MPILEADCPSEFLLLESRSNQGGSVAIDTTRTYRHSKRNGRPAAEKGDVAVTVHSLAKLRSNLRTAIIRYKIAMAMKEVCCVVHTSIHTYIITIMNITYYFMHAYIHVTQN